MRAKSRRVIAEDWQPSNDDRAYADSVGVPIDVEVEKFRDHHLMHGTLMLSVSAGWRTWCRNAVRFGTATGQRAMPLFSVVASGNQAVEFSSDDAYGIGKWLKSVPGAVPDTLAGQPILTMGGYDLLATAREVCEAAGFPASWRGDLSPVTEWLGAGLTPEAIVEAVRSCRRPDKPVLRYFDQRVKEKGRAA